MKKTGSVILAVIMIAGCANMPGQSKKFREGNRVISEAYPAATFGVVNEYQFLSSGEKTEKVSGSASTTSTGRFKSQNFTYAVISNDRIQRLAVIQFNTMTAQRWTWTDSSEWSGPGVIAGHMRSEIGEMRTWKTFGRTVEALPYFGIDVKGRSISSCAAFVTARRIPPAMARFKQLVHYIEPISCSTSDQFYYSDGTLTRTGRYRLDKVYDQAFSDILILSDE